MTDQPEQSQGDADAEPGDPRQRRDSDHDESYGPDGSGDGERVQFDDFALI